jgi:hypothetical protein
MSLPTWRAAPAALQDGLDPGWPGDTNRPGAEFGGIELSNHHPEGAPIGQYRHAPVTSRSEPSPPKSTNPSPDTLPPLWPRLLALSGVAFAVLLVFGWFLSGGDAPDYTATDEVWAAWAGDNRSGSGVGAFLILLAGFALLHFAGTIRSVLGSAERTVRGSVQLARVAFAGAVAGAAGIATAIVIVASATSEGADADPIVTRAVASTSAGPYLVAAMGFAALLAAAGLVTLRSGVLPRWTGIVALVGAVAFLITFLTTIAGLGEDSVFGYGFLPGILALVIWSIATSIVSYRAVTTTAREGGAREADA